MRLKKLALATIAVVCLHRPASAQPEDAQQLFDQGLELMLSGERLSLACTLIRRSLELDPLPGTTFTLAECYRRAGKHASALEYYDEYLSLYERMGEAERAKQGPRAKISRTEREKLVPRVPWLTAVLPVDAPEGVVVTLDERPFPDELLGEAFAVDPGAHVFTTRAPGGMLLETQVRLEPGERERILLNLHVPGTDPPPPRPADDIVTPPPPEEDRSSARRPWIITATTLGFAGLATGAVTGIILLDKRDTIFDGCHSETRECTEEGKAAADLAQNTLAPITTIALGVGAGSLAIAAVLWLTDDSGDPPPSETRRVRPIVAAGPAGASLEIHGLF